MTLTKGRTLGPYEIVSLLGAGGMGEVYRARDTRLNRTVAIKVLPAVLNANAALRERFEREARAISALSHPNICALFDIGSDDGTDYLVMEYLEGETLAERIARGPLPSSQILRYGVQIAEALQKAHRAGITHRDLKPGNIMITSAGAKLLDFGLAKFVDPAPRLFSENSAPATQLGPLTAEGTIVGTFQYMSPEQLEGKNVDHRTDIFSLGVILYEMATGVRPFRGDSPVSLVAAILSTDPVPVRSLQPASPPALERIILTALEKDADDRWQTAQDVGRQLRWLSESSLSTEQIAPATRRRIPFSAILVITAIVAALVTFAAVRFLIPTATKAEMTRLDFALPPELHSVTWPEVTDFAVSPDGRTIAFVATNGTMGSIYVRELDSFDVRNVPGTEDGFCPFWSSDSQWIGFNARGKLWKTKIAGGATPAAICDLKSGAIATWQGETILFSPTRGDHREIYRVAASGGQPVKVTSLQKNEWRHGWPWLLPDGDHYLYLAYSAQSLDRRLVLASLRTSAQSVLANNVSEARVVGKDRLLYVRDGDLLAQRIDVAKGITVGDAAKITSDVGYFYPVARGDFDASPNGTVVYRTNTSSGRLVQFDRKGNETRIIDKGLFWDHALSPDGTKAAVTVETRSTGLMDIWIYDLARGVRDRFTSEPAIEVSPAWAPDGRSIVYSQGEGGTFPHLVQRGITASTSEELTPRGPFQYGANFSPDGDLFYEREGEDGNNICRLSMKTKTSEVIIKTGFTEKSPAVSPDGKWLAFVSNATGAEEVYVQNLAAGSARIRISNKGGGTPRWRRDGRELFYVSPAEEVVSVVPDAQGRWDDARPVVLFRSSGIFGFAVAPDGQSFLISDRAAGAADAFFHVILGFQ